MSCSQVRLELLEHFAFSEELGPRSGPHLAHLESCADCRREVGIDRELVRQLRRALRVRVEGSAPSDASWEHVRSRTIDRPPRRWKDRVPQWGGMVSAAAAAIMMFAVATTPETRLLPGTQTAVFDSAAARQAAPVEEAGGWLLAASTAYLVSPAVPPLPGWPMHTQLAEEGGSRSGEPPITGRMR